MSVRRPRAVDVSVLVPVFNEARHLEAAIAGIVAQDYEGSMEFLFIDGASTDESREVIQRCAGQDHRIRLLENPGRTTPRALNIGLQAARGQFVVRMDAHARYPRDYISRGVARLQRGDVISVSGPQLAVGYDRWSRYIALALRVPLGAGGASFRRLAQTEFEVDSGFTGIWRRSLLIANGGWDVEWVGDEDFELAARLRKSGGRIVCVPALAAEYAPRNSLCALAAQYWRYGQARVRTSRRHPESLRPSQLLPPALAFTAVLSLGGQPAARLARAGTLLYTLALLRETARVARQGKLDEAAALPAVLVTMHLTFGFGFIRAALRDGVPVAALGTAARTLITRAGRFGPS